MRTDIGPSAPITHAADRTAGWIDLVALAFVGIVAAGFRLFRLTTVPPGLMHDEAVNGLDAIWTIPRQHPIFFELNNGREPLFIYFQSLFVALFGQTAWALRLGAVVIGIATVLVTYWVARNWSNRWVAFVASFGVATSFWHVDLSRIGLRAIGAPLFLSLALLFLAKGLRSGRLPWFALGGLALTADLYTYTSARIAPLIVVAVVLWEIVHDRRIFTRRLTGLALYVTVSLITFAPLGAFFVTHPQYFALRANQVWIFNPNPKIESKPEPFSINLERTLGMFFIQGDLDPRQNLPGRPVFDVWSAPWFVLGLGVLLWQALASLQKQRTASDKSTSSVSINVEGWLLIWLVSMLALGALTYESPDFLRLSAMVPAVYIIWGVGVVSAATWIRQHLPAKREVAMLGASLAVVGLLGYEAGQTYYNYFDVWAHRSDVYDGFDSGLTAAANYVNGLASSTPMIFYVDRSPPILFQSEISRRQRWMQGYSNLLLLPPNPVHGAEYIFAGDGSLSGSPSLFFPNQQPAGTASDPAGNKGFVAYHLTPAQVRRFESPAVAKTAVFGDVGDRVELLGYSLSSPTARPGQDFTVTLLWKQLDNSGTVYAPYLHVFDAQGHAWGQDDRLGFAVGNWRQGDQFVSREVWRVPLDAPPMSYQLQVGMAVRSFGYPPGPSKAIGAPISIGTVRVVQPGLLKGGAKAPVMSHPANVNLGHGMELLGYDTPTTPLKVGDSVHLDLLWHAIKAPGADVLVKLSLVDASGHVWSTRTSRPAYGDYPTTKWPAGALVLDPESLVIPSGVSASSLELKLQTVDATNNRVLGHADLGKIVVVQTPRSFTLPSMQHSVNVDFGGQIALKGFNLDQTELRPGGTLHLTLYWQALRAPSRDYTVFTHLLNAANKVVAQQDSQPDHGSSPTLGWLPGQVIRDEYTLTLPPNAPLGTLVLEVGLYDAKTGQRLIVAGPPKDNRFIVAHLPVVSR